jgi:RNA recognition motif-containing protein
LESKRKMPTENEQKKVKLYVGNLTYSVEEEQIKAIFHDHGFEVTDVTLPKDRDTGRLRGFGFVVVETSNASEVVKKMNGVELEGRALKVDEAQERQRTGGAPGGRGGRSGGGDSRGRGERRRDY